MGVINVLITFLISSTHAAVDCDKDSEWVWARQELTRYAGKYLDRLDLIAPVLQFGGNIDPAVLSNSVDCRAGVTSLSLLITLYTLPPPELPQATEPLMKGLEDAGALLETEWPLLSLLSTVHRIVLQDRTEGDCPFEGPISAAIERMTEVGVVLPIPYIVRHLVSLESRRDCGILRATLTVHYHRAERLLETSLLEDIFRYSHIRAEDQEAFIEDALGPSWNASGAVDHVPQLQSAQSIITEFATHNFTVTLSSRAPLLEALDLLTLHPRVTIEARSPWTEEPVHYTQMVFPHRAGSDGLISNRVRAERLPYCTRPFMDLFVAMQLTSVIEVGPHLGDCVLWAVAVTGAIGMAAEPLKQLAEMIRASRDTNGFNSSSLTVFEVAVSDKDGPVVGGAEEPIEYIWGRAVVKTIDSLVESSEAWRQMLPEGRAAGALKIHTNGGEDAVLRGALRTLSHTDGIKLIMVNTNSFKVLSSCYDVILSLPRAYDLFITGHHGALIPLAAPTEHVRDILSQQGSVEFVATISYPPTSEAIL
ncbi:hypothetical protein FOL46_009005 [Perkinsus olseni]|uniref:Uncharacterized protein n=1 Tax=Perkinsus olseni TaxID=32597 RepID=A0A7J6L3L7_PEROL|nr:hypothetical protein FOL46_009005 [Perkinsus olseni]